jgi:hypothetical protein
LRWEATKVETRRKEVEARRVEVTIGDVEG